MSENKAAGVAIQIVDLLTPLESEERQRAVNAALTLLGETAVKPAAAQTPSLETNGEEVDLNPRANIWMKQNNINFEDLEEVFHFADEGIEFIASDVPGSNNRHKAQSVYILCGIQSLLSEGTPAFEDSMARSLCETLGCYDSTNHSKAMKGMGNSIAGSKSKGWTLTAPGLRKAAELIQELKGD